MYEEALCDGLRFRPGVVRVDKRTISVLAETWWEAWKCSTSEALRSARPLAPVAILEPHDVVEVRRRDLEHEEVLDRRDPMHGSRSVPERVPGPISMVSSGPPTSPSSSDARPSWTSHASSFTSWYWRLSEWPALTKRSLPTYASASAQTSSQPQGFSTRRGVTAYGLPPPEPVTRATPGARSRTRRRA